MSALSFSLSSRSSTQDEPSSPNYVPASPASIGSNHSASSSKVDFDLADEENMTITANRNPRRLVKDGSLDDIRLLAISTHMTELSYAISDIQTRIFEIQELRHKSQSSGDNASTNTVIDQSLMTLDERLGSVEKGIKTISETLEPLLRTASTPTVAENGSSGGAPNEEAAILRKHATLLSEWESVQDETEVLREELKEDKWLTVFRTVTDQADGMMSSLEKAVNRCQDFIWQVHRRGHDELQSNAALGSRGERLSINLEVFTTLLESYEAKKKHYMPATSKVLAIIDKGVRDRVTKNGETLRRHAESAQRWKSLRDRISRTNAEMESVRKVLSAADTDHESTTSGTTSTKNGYLATPPNGSRTSRTASSASITLSRSISPFRKFARKLTRTTSSNATTPLQVNKNKPLPAPASEPPLSAVSGSSMRRQRASLFATVRNLPPQTPERPSHKHTRSYTPDSSPHGPKVDKLDLNAISTSKSGPSASKQKWNSSTKIGDDERNATIRLTPKRPPSSSGFYSTRDDAPPVPSLGATGPYRRSLSRASMASSRPWSPVMTSNSTTHSSSHFHAPPVSLPSLRTPSRSQTPSRATTPSFGTTARILPKTPSHTPGAPRTLRSISTPGTSATMNLGPGSPDSDAGFLHSSPHPPRPPSRSMIPVPSVHLQSSSRPASSMSNYLSRAESPTMMNNFRSSAMRAQTPEVMMRSRGIYNGSLGAAASASVSAITSTSSSRTTPRPSMPRLPPSSFRDGSSGTSGATQSAGTPSRGPSRPSSRAGAHTPLENNVPLHEYIPGNPFDPLDVEVGKVVNSMGHGLVVERVDAALKRSQIPKEGEEIKAQYAFSNALSRKVVTCRLTTLSRSSGKGGDGVAGPVTTKKVMCRVGGGWQDLSQYILNRQAGLS